MPARQTRGRRRRLHPEIDSAARLEQWLSSGRTLRGARLQDLDLTAYADRLAARSDLAGLVVLGGLVPQRLGDHLRGHGALVFPTDPHAPVDVYRAQLYTPAELYAGLDEGGYPQTPDAKAYGWATDTTSTGDAFATLLRAIHDDSISDALDEALGDFPVVGVMGGHAATRGSTLYADAADLGFALAHAGLVVLTGGGPGAMEAANLGALATDHDAVARAIGQLSQVPLFEPDVTAWARVGLQVRAELVGERVAAKDADQSLRPGSARPRSIGVPTWFYGHEPPGVFCSLVAKYFSNALREDGLLARSTAGLVVMPGAAGTVQEIFQAVTPMYYDTGVQPLAPLVLVGTHHWTKQVPVWPAVTALADGRAMARAVHLVEGPAEAAALLVG